MVCLLKGSGRFQHLDPHRRLDQVLLAAGDREDFALGSGEAVKMLVEHTQGGI
jgi:hypothetical protein